MYAWLVFVHLVGVVLFAIAHGASVFAAIRLREERDPRAVASLLATSQLAVSPMYIVLVLLGVGGLGAAWSAGLLTAPWIVASYVVVVAVIATMYSVAAPYYRRLRELIGEASPRAAPPSAAPVASDPAALDAALASSRPLILMVAGNLALVLLVWLMVLKPG